MRTVLKTHQDPLHSVTSLLDPDAVARLLADESGLLWPDGSAPTDVRIERFWPNRGEGLAVEWSFALGDSKRWSLYGSAGLAGWTKPDAPECHVRLTCDGLRGVRTYVASWGVRILSPDLDPDLPQLVRCLSGTEMATALRPHLSNGTAGATDLGCRLMGYRAGRRAAIAYRPGSDGPGSFRALGKTYRDHRGDAIRTRLLELAPKLAAVSNAGVRVPTPLEYVPELRMLVLGWHDETPSLDDAHTPNSIDAAVAGMDALSALHRVSLDQLSTFSLPDELAIADRWHAALGVGAHAFVEPTLALLAGLHACGRTVAAGAPCTLHRDFYERQFLLTKQGIVLLDLDTLALGDPAVDVGNYLAHLWLDALDSPERAASFTDVASRLVRRYLTLGGALNRSALRFYWASALFRVGAVHAFRSATGRHAPQLWRLAAALLEADGCARDLLRPGICDRSIELPNPVIVLGAVPS